jgi:hypothetical protein
LFLVKIANIDDEDRPVDFLASKDFNIIKLSNRLALSLLDYTHS